MSAANPMAPSSNNGDNGRLRHSLHNANGSAISNSGALKVRKEGFEMIPTDDARFPAALTRASQTKSSDSARQLSKSKTNRMHKRK